MPRRRLVLRSGARVVFFAERKQRQSFRHRVSVSDVKEALFLPVSRSLAKHEPSVGPTLETQLLTTDRSSSYIVPASKPVPDQEARHERTEDG